MSPQKSNPQISSLPVFFSPYSANLNQFIHVIHEILHLKFTYQINMYKSCKINCIAIFVNGIFLSILSKNQGKSNLITLQFFSLYTKKLVALWNLPTHVSYFPLHLPLHTLNLTLTWLDPVSILCSYSHLFQIIPQLHYLLILVASL